MNTMPIRPLDTTDEEYERIIAAHAEREKTLAENRGESGPPAFMAVKLPHVLNQVEELEAEKSALETELADGVSMTRAIEVADRLREIEDALAAESEDGDDEAGAANADPSYMPVRSPYGDDPDPAPAENRGSARVFLTCSATDGSGKAALID